MSNHTQKMTLTPVEMNGNLNVGMVKLLEILHAVINVKMLTFQIIIFKYIIIPLILIYIFMKILVPFCLPKSFMLN